MITLVATCMLVVTCSNAILVLEENLLLQYAIKEFLPLVLVPRARHFSSFNAASTRETSTTVAHISQQ
jgi:hypothetical protein